MKDDVAANLARHLETRKGIADSLKGSVQQLRVMLDIAEKLAELPSGPCTAAEHASWDELYDSITDPGMTKANNAEEGHFTRIEAACESVTQLVAFLGDVMSDECRYIQPSPR